MEIAVAGVIPLPGVDASKLEARVAPLVIRTGGLKTVGESPEMLNPKDE